MYFLYFLLWVIFNGSFTVEIAVFGLMISAVLFAFTCKFMDYSVAQEKANIRNAFQVIAYIFLLIREILVANTAVIRLILTQREEIVPELVTFHSQLKTPSAKAFLANAITLTPGTITVTLEGDRYVVHCLDESMAEGIENLEFQKRLAVLERSCAVKTEGESGQLSIEEERKSR